jgi:hypothetical protein
MPNEVAVTDSETVVSVPVKIKKPRGFAAMSPEKRVRGRTNLVLLIVILRKRPRWLARAAALLPTFLAGVVSQNENSPTCLVSSGVCLFSS